MFLSQARSLMTTDWLDKQTKVTGVGKTLVSTHFLKFFNLQVRDCKVNTLIYVQLNGMF